jgi:hypothetical protein
MPLASLGVLAQLGLCIPRLAPSVLIPDELFTTSFSWIWPSGSNLLLRLSDTKSEVGAAFSSGWLPAMPLASALWWASIDPCRCSYPQSSLLAFVHRKAAAALPCWYCHQAAADTNEFALLRTYTWPSWRGVPWRLPICSPPDSL